VKYEQLSLRLQTASSGQAWLLTDAPQNGDRAGVSIWPEGDHAGSTREVPQEDKSPSMYILNACVSSLMRYKTMSRMCSL
jgi:hypothetical protein